MTKDSATALVGLALAGSVGLTQAAAGNPFVAQDLGTGYMQLAEADTEGKCGSKDEEGKCGSKDDDDKGGEGSCGGSS
ncbi:hypothetical protein CKO36_06670 [Rhabdochromatium marinum]|nr:hypothetical protein [Rhabdochromatium marinum]